MERDKKQLEAQIKQKKLEIEKQRALEQEQQKKKEDCQKIITRNPKQIYICFEKKNTLSYVNQLLHSKVFTKI